VRFIYFYIFFYILECTFTMHSIKIYFICIKQSHYRPGQALRFPGGSGSQIYRQSVHEGGKVVSPTHRPPLPHRKYSWYSFMLEAEATGRIMSMKNSNDTIGNRTCDLPACSACPHISPVFYVHVNLDTSQ
jgi:hypothetical protein